MAADARGADAHASVTSVEQQKPVGLWSRSSLHVKGLILFAIPLLPLLALVATALLQAREDARLDELVAKLRGSRIATEHLLSTALDAETGIRGYVATGNPEFLEPFDAALANLSGLAQEVRAAEMPPEARSLLEEQYERLLALRERGPSLPPARQEELLLQGKQTMDRVRDVLGAHIDAQQESLDVAQADRERLHGRIELILWLGAVGGLIGGAIGVLLFVREIAARIKLLQRNSSLLGGPEPLATVAGRDEIATLGHVLEATQRELSVREARRREAEAEMIRSRDEAERANAAKSEFLSRMSHELRTPLNSILGFAQLLEMDGLPPDQGDNVKQILRGGNHLLNLINEILDISRIESGRLSISVEPMSLKPVLDESVMLVQPLAAARSITVRATVSPGAERALVMADPQRLKQIVLNLLSNAIKYNRDRGSVDLVVTRSDERVRVEVRDTGPGLTEDQIRHMFTPFERLGAEALGVEGTGLGLALSKGLAEAMGAEIGVASELGRGTSFFVDLTAAKDPHEVPAQTSGGPATSPGDPDVRTVLYIEDNLSNLALVKSILARRKSISLATAPDGHEGIELALRLRPDLILLDVNLPDLDGYDVLTSLRTDPSTSSIPIVMVSADATQRQIERFKRAGALDYVTKPLDVQRFLRAVDRALNQEVA